MLIMEVKWGANHNTVQLNYADFAPRALTRHQLCRS